MLNVKFGAMRTAMGGPLLILAENKAHVDVDYDDSVERGKFVRNLIDNDSARVVSVRREQTGIAGANSTFECMRVEGKSVTATVWLWNNNNEGKH